METPASESRQRLVWAAAILLIVVCGAGVGVMMGWIPTSLGKPEVPVLTKLEQPVAQAPGHRTGDREGSDIERQKARDKAKQPVRAPVVAAVRCAECGVVQSVREVKSAKSAKSYEITVNFDDGSDRVFTEASAPSWRDGDKVRIVDGVLQSNA